MALRACLPSSRPAPPAAAGLAAYVSWVPTLRHLAEAMQQLVPRPAAGDVTTAGHTSDSGGGSGGGGGGGGGGSSGPLVCCFTDFNEEAMHRARQLCAHVLAGCGAAAGTGPRGEQGSSGGSGSDGDGGGLCGGVDVESRMNAFRRPAAVLAADHALPSAGNGFALWLLPRGPPRGSAAPGAVLRFTSREEEGEGRLK